MPSELTRKISRYQACGLALTFSIISLLHLWVFQSGVIDHILPARDYVFGPYTGQKPIALRAFIICFYISFAIHASGTIKARMLLGFELVLYFLVICGVLDFGSLALLGFLGIPHSLGVLQVIAGLLGFALFSFVILARGAMPVPVPVEMGTQFINRAMFRLLLTSAISTSIAVWVSFHHYGLLDRLREAALLGGIGPGVVLFIALTFLQLYIIAVVERWFLSRPEFVAPLTVIVPAYNE